jgi:hypothetical protein
VTGFRSAPGSEVEITLGRGATMRGVVRRADGSPIAEAQVRLAQEARSIGSRPPPGEWGIESEELLSYAASGADGRFEIVGIQAPATYRPYVVAAGLPLRPFDVERFDSDDSVVEHDFEVGQVPIVELRVFDPDGRRVRDGSVELVRDVLIFRESPINASINLASTRLDPNRDRVLIEVPETGWYQVIANGLGFGSVRQRIEVVAERGPPIDLYLPEGGTIAGIVVDADGVPSPRARVWLSPRGVECGQQFARCCDDGRFEAHGVVGDVNTISACLDDDQSCDGTAEARTGDRDVRVVVRSESIVVGRVVPASAATSLTVGFRHAEGRADGTFRVAVSNEDVIVVECAGFAPFAIRDERALPKRGTLDVGEVRLSPGYALEGTVRDEEGAPIEGALVMVANRFANLELPPESEWNSYGPSGWAGTRTYTGSDGRYRLADLTSDVEVSVQKSGFAAVRRRCGGSAAGSPDVQLVRGGEVVGRVTLPERHDDDHDRVEVERLGEPAVAPADDAVVPATLEADDGHMFHGWFPPGRYRLTVRRDRIHQARVTVQVDVEVVAGARAPVELRVR